MITLWHFPFAKWTYVFSFGEKLKYGMFDNEETYIKGFYKIHRGIKHNNILRVEKWKIKI